MPLNITSAESAFLDGYSKFEAWKTKFEGVWYAPIGEMQLQMMWKQLPEAVKAQLRATVPEEVEAVEKMIGGNVDRRTQNGKAQNGRKEEREGNGFTFAGAEDEGGGLVPSGAVMPSGKKY